MKDASLPCNGARFAVSDKFHIRAEECHGCIFFFGSFPLKRDKNDRDSLLWKKRKITMCWQEEGMKRKAQAAGRKEEVSLYHVIIGK